IIILSTHIMALAEDLCDIVAVLDKGKLQTLDIDRKHEQFEERLLQVLKGDEYDK
ncbi:ABC transporter ATP-binding protein, partial [Streptococcus agalactiae]|nr:ABC transporter ATP-binding protein [Streptococcus agalactiae]